MARSAVASRRGKPVYTLLAVIFGKKPAVNGSSATAEVKSSLYLLPNISGFENEAFLLPGKDKSVHVRGVGGYRSFPDLTSGGQLEVVILEYPSKEELKQKVETLHPEFVSFHGERLSGKDDVGGLVLADSKISSLDDFVSLFGTKLPDLVYLECPSGEKLGQAVHSLGCKHVIYWKISSLTWTLAFHFRQGLVASLQSSAAGGYDAYHLAKACIQVFCCQSKLDGQQVVKNGWPQLLGDAPPKVELPPTEASSDGEGTKAAEAAMSAIQIFDDEVEVRLLICTELTKPDVAWLEAMEAGLNSVLAIEARGVRLLNRISAPPPPMAAALFARGIVTMRCDICTASYARVPLLVSGSAQLCFDDLQLETSIKKELVERTRLVRVLKSAEDRKASSLSAELRRSVSVACGASVFELRMITPAWAGQVLRQLSAESSYRSLVALGVAGVEGAAVAAFRREDTLRLSSTKIDRLKEADLSGSLAHRSMPSWLTPPVASRKRFKLFHFSSPCANDSLSDEDGASSSKAANGEESSSSGGNRSENRTFTSPGTKSDSRYTIGKTSRQNLALLEAMKPVPHRAGSRTNPYAVVVATAHAGWSMKVNMPNGVSGKVGRPHSSSLAGSLPNLSALGGQTAITPSSLLLAVNAPLVKPHGCSRQPIEDCAEEDFLADLIKFLVSRGHGRLIPPAGAEAFPEVILNGKRLDLYNLYREVVSRGGFHVGNGINWKGQVFSKMRNHTLTNKMTGVGNTLKKHYETYLLEYELAHNDVDGECCILCHSGAAGDWVNCGICGEWAHFGCDKRTGLGTFKEYSKTDGLEYICPNCSTANGRVTKRSKIRSSSDGSPPHAEAAISKGVPRRTSR
ncbi:hypothetical protein R1flu_011585 [Riccia fluitans]|uniref:ARID domain-containing protein n=1 Tax=Riccia fluitans TaxID=41844 RepID=A0ABD1Z9B8_9MARC